MHHSLHNNFLYYLIDYLIINNYCIKSKPIHTEDNTKLTDGLISKFEPDLVLLHLVLTQGIVSWMQQTAGG